MKFSKTVKFALALCAIAACVAVGFNYRGFKREARNIQLTDKTKPYTYQDRAGSIKITIPDTFSEHKNDDGVELYDDKDTLQLLGTLRITLMSVEPKTSAPTPSVDSVLSTLLGSKVCDQSEKLANENTLCSKQNDHIERGTPIVIFSRILVSRIDEGNLLVASITYTTTKELEKAPQTVQLIKLLDQAVQAAELKG